MASRFVHLHNHTDYSLLDGAAPIARYVQKAKQYGMEHLAITDHGNLFGALRFYDACKKEGINPIIGCEVYIAPESRFSRDKQHKYYHMILFAKNEPGYRNLIELVSLSYQEGFYFKPRIDDELLTRYHDHLIATGACIAGEIPQWLIAGNYEKAKERALFYRNLFGSDNYYLELQRHGLEREQQIDSDLIRLAHELSIPLIATNDIHYIERDDFDAHEVLLCIGTGTKLTDEKRFRFDRNEFYFKSPEAMEQLYADIPEAIDNTLRLARQCQLTLNRPGPLLPDYPIPPEFSTAEDYVRQLVATGLQERYPVVTDAIRKRADYELSVIFNMNGNSFAGYFLIVWDFINYAKTHGIPVGPGRGSGAGSIVAYAMKITDIDPLKYNLLFERFLNPDRVSMPDFDVDFCYEGRAQVIDYVTQRYGAEKVGAICTFGTLKLKAVLKDVARVLDIPFSESNAISALAPEGKYSVPKLDANGKPVIDEYTGEAETDEIPWNLPLALEKCPELKAWYDKGGRYQRLFEIASVLENLNRHVSTHACGIVIGQKKLTEYVPLFKDPKEGQMLTQYTMDLLEPCGLVKMDFLGLKTLTLIKNTVQLIHKTHPDFQLETISEDDADTFALLGEGKTEAIFQFESTGMQKILRDVKPSSIEEMIALNALYRPGPLKFIDQYIDTKQGKRKPEYPDPSLESILKPTYGVIVYQEQVMQVAQTFAGFTLARADEMRRAMGKKKPEVLKAMQAEFVEGARQKGHSKEQAEKIFNLLVPFSKYGFNKSHAAAYAVLAYKTAFLKAHYPAEFMAANLTNEISNPDKFAQYLAVTRQMGIEILPPNLNKSENSFSVVDGTLYYGLQGIKKVGATVVESIIGERNANGPFTDFTDFLMRVDLRTVNRGIVEAFIYAGLFDEFHDNRAALMLNLDAMLAYASKQREMKESPQLSLFGEQVEAELIPKPTLQPAREWSDKQKRTFETEYLGFSFSGHPLDPFKAIIERSVTLHFKAMPTVPSRRSLTTVSIITDLTVMTVKKPGKNYGRELASGTLADYNGTAKFIVFMDAWETYRPLMQSAYDDEQPLAFIGHIAPDKNGSMENPQFQIEKVMDPAQLSPSPAPTRSVHIRLLPNSEQESLFELRDFIFENTGDSIVYLHFPSKSNPQHERIVQTAGSAKINPIPAVMDRLSRFHAVKESWVQ